MDKIVYVILHYYTIEDTRKCVESIIEKEKDNNYEIVVVDNNSPNGTGEELITFVEDRKGHDYRYAIDPTKIKNELGWEPKTKFEDGIVKTIDWYLENKEWLR